MYHITHIKNGELKHKYFKFRKDARRFISNNLNSVLSCWWQRKLKGSKTVDERVFRNRTEHEPLDFFNNKIKAKINKQLRVISS